MIRFLIIVSILLFTSSSYADQKICLTPDCKVKGIYTDKMKDKIKRINNPLYSYEDTEKYGIEFVERCMEDSTYCVGSNTPLNEIPLAVRIKYKIGEKPKEKVIKNRPIHITFYYDNKVHQNVLTITNNENNDLNLKMVYMDAINQCTHAQRFKSYQIVPAHDEFRFYLPKGCSTGIVHQVLITTTDGRVINIKEFDYE